MNHRLTTIKVVMQGAPGFGTILADPISLTLSTFTPKISVHTKHKGPKTRQTCQYDGTKL